MIQATRLAISKMSPWRREEWRLAFLDSPTWHEAALRMGVSQTRAFTVGCREGMRPMLPCWRHLTFSVAFNPGRPAADEFRRLYRELGCVALATLLDVSAAAVSGRALRLGLRGRAAYPAGRRWSDA